MIAAVADESASSALGATAPRGGRLTASPALTWFLVAVAAATTVVYGVANEDVAAPTIFLLFAAIGYALFRRHGAKYFAISYSLNAILIAGLAVYLQHARGAPFLPGGDEVTFHDASLTLAHAWMHGQWSASRDYIEYSGYGFILIGALVQLLTSWAGNASPIAIRELNAFVGATIPVAIYLTGNVLFHATERRISSRAAAATAAFPILAFYSAVGLRDIWIAAAVAWCGYSLLCAAARRSPVLTGLVCPIILGALTFAFRPDSLAPYLALFGIFLLALPASPYARLLKPIAVVALGALIVSEASGLQTKFEQVQERYTEFALAGADESSLGAKLLALPTPANQVGRFLYASVSPVPPATGTKLYQLVVGLGAVEWYFILPVAVIGALAGLRVGPTSRAYMLAVAAYAAVLIAGIAMTSGDVRHKLPVFAVAILCASLAIEVRGRRSIARLLALVGSGYVALAIVYLSLKGM